MLTLPVAAALAAITVALSVVPYGTSAGETPELAVSFKVPGALDEVCRDLTPEELEKRPPHMRQGRECERRRSAVRLRVTVDGEVRVDGRYEPAGLWGDGLSVALERFEVPAGSHRVRVELDDGSAGGESWPHSEEQTLEFRPRERRVVLFERGAGMSWY